jgi:hypothetical protein
MSKYIMNICTKCRPCMSFCLWVDSYKHGGDMKV